MTDYQGETAITIQAPVEKIYAYLVDFQRHPEWAKNLTKVTQTSVGPMGVGATFKTEEGPPPLPLGQTIIMMGHFILGLLSGAKPYSEAKITALEPQRRIAWQAGVPKGQSYLNFAEWEFVFDAQGEATRLTQRFHYIPPDARGERLIAVAGVKGIERACAVSLAQLKRRLEQSENRSQ